MSQNEDRRIRRTKKAMNAALAELLMEKPLNKISVREIAERADINRGTFYLHYRDVYDMVEKIQNEIFAKYHDIVNNYEQQKNSKAIFPMLVRLFQLLEENSDLARVLVGKNGDVAFLDKLKNEIKEVCLADAKEILHMTDEREFYYFYEYITAGCSGLCAAWLSGGMEETPEEMAMITERFVFKK